MGKFGLFTARQFSDFFEPIRPENKETAGPSGAQPENADERTLSQVKNKSIEKSTPFLLGEISF